MAMKNSFSFELFLYFILIVKIAFLITVLLTVISKRNGSIEEIDKYTAMNHKLHSIFTISMGVLLLILFNPRSNSKIVCVDGHIKLFLYIFGVLSILGIVQHFIDEKKEEKKEKEDTIISNN
jgi:Na+/proline symporter